MTAPEIATGWTVRAATEADQPAIRALVRSEKLNPTMLAWPAFVVAVSEGEIGGVAQIRRHKDGSRELGSVVVAPAHRGSGIAERLILTLLVGETGPVYVVTARSGAERYRRFGFRKIQPDQAPRRVRRNLRLGALFGGAHSLLHGRRPVPLVILERPASEDGSGGLRVRPATRTYRTWGIDSSRWEGFKPRPDDIVIVTYPKCGTTWMQRIVGLLIFQDPRPIPIMEVSPWIDCRFVETAEATLARVEGQQHRRFLKSHLPADGLPLFEDVRYIMVARDGRDACLSYHNHVSSYTPWMLSRLDAAGAEDRLGPYPRALPEPADFFHRWLTEGIPPDGDGLPLMSYFHFQQSWWEERGRPNVHMVHYADLLADLPGQMRRVADFLDVTIAPERWPALEAAAGFEAMRAIGDTLLGRTGAAFSGGGSTFFHHGRNGRWRDVLPPAHLALYDAKLTALPADLAGWLEHGGPVPTDTPAGVSGAARQLSKSASSDRNASR